MADFSTSLKNIVKNVADLGISKAQEAIDKLDVKNSLSPDHQEQIASLSSESSQDQQDQAGRDRALYDPSTIETVPEQDEDQVDGEQADDDGNSLSPSLENIASTAADMAAPAADFYYDPEEAKRAFDEWGTRDPDAIREYNELLAAGEEPDEDLTRRALPKDASSEFVRRFTYGDGTWRIGNDINLLGINAVNATPDAPRRLYEANFRREEREGIPDNLLTSGMTGGVIGNGDIDDGSIEGRTSAWMTGDRYLQYINEFGLPGRQADDIDPDMLYNKQEEMERYGFIPYLRDDSDIYGEPFDWSKPLSDYFTSGDWRKGYYNSTGWQKVNNLFNDFANLRRDNAGFRVTDGASYFDGRDFVNAWKHQNDRLREQMQDMATVVTDPSEASEDSIPYTIMNPTTGEKAPSSYYLWDREDNLVFIDDAGNVVGSWPKDDMVDGQFPYAIASEGDSPVAWKNVDPLVMPDGSKIRADRAWDIYNQVSMLPTDDPSELERLSDIADRELVDYSGLLGRNTGRQTFSEFPGSFQEVPGFLKGMADREELLPWMTDLALGSLPFFWLPTGGLRGIARAASELNGFEPGRNPDGSYRLISEDPTSDLASQKALGSAIMPFTEHLWGPLGGSAVGGATHWVNKYLFDSALKSPAFMKHPVAKWLANSVVGEGAEEIPGNLTEELERSGFDDFYKDYIEGAYDRYGHQLRADTDAQGRISNLKGDVPEAVTGGALLGGTLGVVPGIMDAGKDMREYRDAKNSGSVPRVEDTGMHVPTSDERVDYYNRYAQSLASQLRPKTIEDAIELGLFDDEVSDYLEESGLSDAPFTSIEDVYDLYDRQTGSLV